MKDIIGFEGLYAVTVDGKIWSYPKFTKMPNGKGIRADGNKWITPFFVTKRTNHQRVYLHKNGKTFGIFVHRLVAQAYIENPFNYPYVNHIDGNPLNNHTNNLEWCNASMNSKHAITLGLTKIPNQIGASNSQAKLTDFIIKEIRLMFLTEKNCAKIGRHFNLKPKHAYDICHFRCWKHVI